MSDTSDFVICFYETALTFRWTVSIMMQEICYTNVKAVESVAKLELKIPRNTRSGLQRCKYKLYRAPRLISSLFLNGTLFTHLFIALYNLRVHCRLIICSMGSSRETVYIIPVRRGWTCAGSNPVIAIKSFYNLWFSFRRLHRLQLHKWGANMKDSVYNSTRSQTFFL